MATSRSEKPRWDKRLRVLSLAGVIVKRFQHPAPSAERILDSFQEENWVERIDDPLTPLPSREEARRLRNQIQALNRRLTRPIIRFAMDGTGKGIRWFRLDVQSQSLPHSTD